MVVYGSKLVLLNDDKLYMFNLKEGEGVWYGYELGV
jgi:hypothetical protein